MPTDRDPPKVPDPEGVPAHVPEEVDHEDVLRLKLEVLRQEHRDLDAAIRAMEEQVRPDLLAIKRLKKQKLVLKDRIARIEDELLPDIIA